MLIVDSHEDLAWSMLSFGRDYTLSSAEIRRREQGTPIPTYNDEAMLGYDDFQLGQVALIFASLFALPVRLRTGSWESIFYLDSRQASRLYHQQLEVYQRLTDEHYEKFRLIRYCSEMEDLLRSWEVLPEFDEDTGALRQSKPVGLIISMENAEAVRNPGELDEWWERGLRLIGPAWASNRFCGGTNEPGPLTSEGYALLERMSELGFGLDLTHMDEKAVLQALDTYAGVLFASHSNAQALLNKDETNRHLSDKVIHGILERDGVIGVNPYNAFLKAGWKKGNRRQEVLIDHLIDQIDYLCQMAGNSSHVGIGTDFDGGFGLQSAPTGFDTIADLQKLVPLLVERGYTTQDCAAILGENWLSMLRKVLP